MLGGTFINVIIKLQISPIIIATTMLATKALVAQIQQRNYKILHNEHLLANKMIAVGQRNTDSVNCYFISIFNPLLEKLPHVVPIPYASGGYLVPRREFNNFLNLAVVLRRRTKSSQNTDSYQHDL